MQVFQLSAKTGVGVEDYLAFLAGHLPEAPRDHRRGEERPEPRYDRDNVR
jgi:hypothetical protein